MKRILRVLLVRSVLSEKESRHLLHLVVDNDLFDPHGVRHQLIRKLRYYASDMERPFAH